MSDIPDDHRVVFVSPDLRTGGAEQHWLLLVRGFAARGLRPVVLTYKERGELFETFAAEADTFHVDAPARMGVARHLGAVRKLVRLDPAVVFSRTVSGMLLGHLGTR